MRQLIFGAALAALLPFAAHAEGDAAAGEKAFAPCKSCHAYGKNGGVYREKLDEDAWEEVEDALLSADVGVASTT